MFHDIAEGHLAPAATAFWRGQRIDQFARLRRVAVQAFTNRFDLRLDCRLVFSADFFDVRNALFELFEILINRLHQLRKFAFGAFSVFLERLIRHFDKLRLRLFHHLLSERAEFLTLFGCLALQFGQFEPSAFSLGALRL